MNFLEKVRRNHGIEHATVHVLSEANPNLSVIGRADGGGFAIIGDVDPETLLSAALEALRRMQNGQSALAVHPRCGTMLVTMGALTAVAAFLALGRKPKLSRLPDAILATTLAAFVAQPAGLALQKYVTTSPNVQAARAVGVTRKNFAGMEFWHVDIEWTDETSSALE
ncbi:hypothetical protein FBQ82_08045 [Anaerolineae bacterium CFX7]|nr:hypothetical protein [Anaerolineae bacterium CFX7]